MERVVENMAVADYTMNNFMVFQYIRPDLRVEAASGPEGGSSECLSIAASMTFARKAATLLHDEGYALL